MYNLSFILLRASKSSLLPAHSIFVFRHMKKMVDSRYIRVPTITILVIVLIIIIKSIIFLHTSNTLKIVETLIH